MRITFDTSKDQMNSEKRGVSLSLAALIDWFAVMAKPDRRRDYGEVREIGYAVVDQRLYCVVFTQRGESMPIISLRRANIREVRDYAKA
ncbi:BrnT family toxin [Alcaligenaceae bacterium A4P071]|nr:BrnT family toxin [Alcaligenaceae bacterium A4P071]